MNASVKPRRYRSALRADQARLTRATIVTAGAKLFAKKGYAAVSIDEIAQAAGVSRATVFNAVGGKPVLLREAYRQAFSAAAGGEEDSAIPLVERPRSQDVRTKRTASEYLSAYAALSTAISSHMAGVYEAIREAARSDRNVGALWEAMIAERRRGASTIVADLKARARLRAGLDDEVAADLVWALNDPGLYHMLVNRRGWPEERFQKWLARALSRELLGLEV